MLIYMHVHMYMYIYIYIKYNQIKRGYQLENGKGSRQDNWEELEVEKVQRSEEILFELKTCFTKEVTNMERKGGNIRKQQTSNRNRNIEDEIYEDNHRP